MMMSSRIAPLCLFLSAGACVSAEAQSPELGYGYPGRLDPYDISVELKSRLDKFGMTAGWFRRDAVSADDLQSAVLQVNELPYLLYSTKHSTKPVPMVIYFGGTGEQGTNLCYLFRQTTAFAKLTSKDFQARHPCYVFSIVSHRTFMGRCRIF